MKAVRGFVSGIDVKFFGGSSLRCFAFVNPNGPGGSTDDVQVYTENIPFQKVLQLGCLLRVSVEVTYDEARDGNKITAARVLDR